jgi:membrane complex biogenesis BtpA family protein
MRRFESLGQRKVVLGMVHLRPLPGTPFHEPGSFEETLATAVESARALEQGGADGCLVQTVDRVYGVEDEADPARVAALTLIVQAVIDATGEDFQVGVQLMRNAVSASLGIAAVTGASFVRATAVVGATLSPHGLVEAAPLAVAEYRSRVGAESVKLIGDIDSMHFKWFGGGRPAGALASDARLVGADGVSLGRPDPDETLALVAEVRKAAPGMPVVLAGYTNHENAARLVGAADGAFVGSCLERGGWGGRIDAERVAEYVEIVRATET